MYEQSLTQSLYNLEMQYLYLNIINLITFCYLPNAANYCYLPNEANFCYRDKLSASH